MNFNILHSYCLKTPSRQTAVDTFRGHWSSKLPEDLISGEIGLFEDERMKWALAQLGIQGKAVLELGPLEAGHTFMLHQAGAQSITAIEANTQSYLKCLVVKEIFDLKRTRFLCGDFLQHLNTTDERYDVGIASGVLYHLINPLDLIFGLARATNAVFVWTHYYAEEIIKRDRRLKRLFLKKPLTLSHERFHTEVYQRSHPFFALHWKKFCGGGTRHSHWMRRDEILRAFEKAGFSDFSVAFEDLSHINGPSFAFVARKKTA